MKKSNVLLFNLSQNKKQKETINIEDHKLALKEYAKYLDVYTDYHLSWKKHIEITNSRISKGIYIYIGILKKMCKFLQEKQLKTLYNVFIKPYRVWYTCLGRGSKNTSE